MREKKMAIKWDAAAIIAGLVAVVGGAVWLGNLQSKIDNIDPDAIIEKMEQYKKDSSLNGTLPVGTVIMYWGVETPDGFEICDGSIIQDKKSQLYEVKKPDFKGRFPLMQDTMGNHKKGGVSEIVLTEQHLPPHSHPNPGIGRGSEKIEKKDNYRKNYLEQGDKHKSNSSLNSGPSDAMQSKAINIMPPFQSVTCLIKVR